MLLFVPVIVLVVVVAAAVVAAVLIVVIVVVLTQGWLSFVFHESFFSEVCLFMIVTVRCVAMDSASFHWLS